MTHELARAASAAYGLRNAVIEPLSGGLINRVWRVSAGSETCVLKQYISGEPIEQVRQSIRALNVAGARGLPVPAVFPAAGGDLVVELPEGVFVLSEFLPGRLHAPDQMPSEAARNMGEALAKLHDALGSMPPGKVRPLPRPDQIEEHLRMLLHIARGRGGDPVDGVAARALEMKLELLSTIDAMPDFVPQWTHGDFEWRNVLFDEQGRVAGIIDFDDVQYFSPARDLMRCIALSFPSLGPEVDDFFRAYANLRRLSPGDARAAVDFYRYISTQRVWPISARYLDAEHYDPRWDQFIQPHPAWDWQALSDRLANAAPGAPGDG